MSENGGIGLMRCHTRGVFGRCDAVGGAGCDVRLRWCDVAHEARWWRLLRRLAVGCMSFIRVLLFAHQGERGGLRDGWLLIDFMFDLFQIVIRWNVYWLKMCIFAGVLN